MLLQPYMGQMAFVHKGGKKHLNVDALSRLTRKGDSGDGGDYAIISGGGTRATETVTGAFLAEGLRRRRRLREQF
jgi:hypothetical protein